MEFIQQILVGITIASISAVVTVKLSLNRFRAEKVWERKLQAYENVIDAFHQIKKYYDEHYSSSLTQTRMSEEQKEELSKAQVKGRAELSRAIDIGGLLLNSNAILAVECYLSNYHNCPDFDFYEEHLDHNWSITDKALKEFIVHAKIDLEK
ncbi:hypothetical protein GT360_21305 [Vibrio astriarenae]|uniref:Uncharacterized protein n=1 Tax=Vibrio astriarenae TaxID=1481923 RepID=A0A7Z2YFY8_9VIBR|nr:hypothetical protein [Vibrio astriarenae]QIA66032.1 hypothetical protein GT360_21305 [Vibrio astriarenae]